jgi:hypothetical protein
MGALLLAYLQLPDDGTDPDWPAGHAAIDTLTFPFAGSARYDDLTETLAGEDALPTVPDDEHDAPAMRAWEAAVTAAGRRRLHQRVDELREAYGTAGGGMDPDLTLSYPFGHRLLVTGGRSSGSPPTELFDTLNELAGFPQVTQAMGCDRDMDGDRPPADARRTGPPGSGAADLTDTATPTRAATPYLDVGEVVEVPGYGRRRLQGDGALSVADPAVPPAAVLPLGTVAYLRSVGYHVVREDPVDPDSDHFGPVLVPLAEPD